MIRILNYFKYLAREKNYFILGYVAFCTIFPLLTAFELSSMIYTVFNILLLAGALSKVGQTICAYLIGGRKIHRQEHMEGIELPIRKYINELKADGLDLEDDIRIYVSNVDYPFVYAIGRNTLVVSNAFLDLGNANPDIFEAKVKFELYRMNNQESNTILAIVGANFIVGSFLLMFLLVGQITLFFFRGNRAVIGGVILYTILAIVGLWCVFSFFIIRMDVRKKIRESDEYVAKHNLGEALCFYLDNVIKPSVPIRLKVFQLGHPNVDERIGYLQAAEVDYYA